MITTIITAALRMGIALQAKAQPLKRYNWTNRPLLIFAARETSSFLAHQRRIIDASIAGFRDRDMVVIEIVGNSIRSRLGQRPELFNAFNSDFFN